jgi:SPP1 family predicted phage head-tail adaptor
MKSQAQRYRHRIEIQERVETQDSETGEITSTWETLALDSETPLDSVPAEVLTGPGREFVAGDAKQAETSARIAFRWFPGLLPTHRILWDGRVYDVQSIETDLTARREYRLRCKDGVSDGT